MKEGYNLAKFLEENPYLLSLLVDYGKAQEQFKSHIQAISHDVGAVNDMSSEQFARLCLARETLSKMIADEILLCFPRYYDVYLSSKQ